jgi:hypothetical protein
MTVPSSFCSHAPALSQAVDGDGQMPLFGETAGDRDGTRVEKRNEQ